MFTSNCFNKRKKEKRNNFIYVFIYSKNKKCYYCFLCVSNRTEKGYPLTIEPTKIEYEESPCDIEFIQKMLRKINYDALLLAREQIIEHCSVQLGSDFVLPELPNSMEEERNEVNEISKELLSKLHKILLDIHIVEGHLICPDTGRRFKVSNGIPNMILHEDEI